MAPMYSRQESAAKTIQGARSPATPPALNYETVAAEVSFYYKTRSSLKLWHISPESEFLNGSFSLNPALTC